MNPGSGHGYTAADAKGMAVLVGFVVVVGLALVIPIFIGGVTHARKPISAALKAVVVFRLVTVIRRLHD